MNHNVMSMLCNYEGSTCNLQHARVVQLLRWTGVCLPYCVNVSIFLSFRLNQANARLQDERRVLVCQNKGVFFFYVLQNAKCKATNKQQKQKTRVLACSLLLKGYTEYGCCNARTKSAGVTIFRRCTLLAKWNGNLLFFVSTYQSQTSKIFLKVRCI